MELIADFTLCGKSQTDAEANKRIMDDSYIRYIYRINDA